MAPRLELQALLRSTLGSNNVYFQPPPNITMQYPCIVYSRDDRDSRFANNKPYAHLVGYQVTVIDRNPDSLIPDRVANLPLCEFQRTYTADNLNHDVYKLFF
jgi:hypothetical protein